MLTHPDITFANSIESHRSALKRKQSRAQRTCSGEQPREQPGMRSQEYPYPRYGDKPRPDSGLYTYARCATTR